MIDSYYNCGGNLIDKFKHDPIKDAEAPKDSGEDCEASAYTDAFDMQG